MRALIIIASFALAACSPPAETAAPMEEPMAEMSAAEPAAPSGTIAAAGTVTAIDSAAGTVTISHGPIPEVGWSSMTMSFRAEDPALLQAVSVGDTVTFEVKSAAEPDVVTAIAKQ